MIWLLPSSLADAQQPSSVIAESREETSGLKTRKHLSNGDAGLEIRGGGKHRIPASAFEYKISIPSRQAD